MRIQADKRFELRECPACGTEVSENNNRCPICGYEFPAPTPRQRFARMGGALIMLLLLVWLVLAVLW